MEFFLCCWCQMHSSVAGQFQEEYLSEEHQNWSSRTSHRTGGCLIQPVVRTPKLFNSCRFAVHLKPLWSSERAGRKGRISWIQQGGKLIKALLREGWWATTLWSLFRKIVFDLRWRSAAPYCLSSYECLQKKKTNLERKTSFSIREEVKMWWWAGVTKAWTASWSAYFWALIRRSRCQRHDPPRANPAPWRWCSIQTNYAE